MLSLALFCLFWFTVPAGVLRCAQTGLKPHLHAAELVSAARRGDRWLVGVLLDRGLDPNMPNEYGELALSAASAGGHTSTVKLLLAHGANPNARNDSENTALADAAERGRTEVCLALLAAGADVNAPSGPEFRPLQLAAMCPGNSTLTVLLLSHGADPNAAFYFGWSPLAGAVLSWKHAAVARLLQSGAHINAVSRIGPYTALEAAALRGDLWAFRYLLHHGADAGLRPGPRHTGLITWPHRGGNIALLRDARMAVRAAGTRHRR